MVDKQVIKDLINVRKTLQQKYLNLKRGQVDGVVRNEEQLKPVTVPLKELLAETIKGRTQRHPPNLKKEAKHEIADFREIQQTRTENLRDFPENQRTHYESPNELEDLEARALTPTGRYEREPAIETLFNESEDLEARSPAPDDTYESEPGVESLSFNEDYDEIFIDKFGHVAGPYIRLLFDKNQKNIDKIYGFTNLGDNGLVIGKTPIKIDLNDIILDDEFVYEGTPGIYELLVLKKPQYYTRTDLNNYKSILERTGVHLDITGKIKSNRGYKYQNIIRNLFEKKTPKTGSSYQYWDDVNELVDRLRLLYSSSSAGHSGHRNEIIDILEELKEANIIY